MPEFAGAVELLSPAGASPELPALDAAVPLDALPELPSAALPEFPVAPAFPLPEFPLPEFPLPEFPVLDAAPVDPLPEFPFGADAFASAA